VAKNQFSGGQIEKWPPGHVKREGQKKACFNSLLYSHSFLMSHTSGGQAAIFSLSGHLKIEIEGIWPAT
jgi:hypothetical protein